jgi:hypothetical protein
LFFGQCIGISRVVGDVEHALEPQQCLGARSFGANLLGETRGDRQHVIECGLIDADVGRLRATRQAQVGVDAAARNRLGQLFAHFRFERFIARRHAQAHIEAAIVYAAQFPMPRGALARAVAAGKPGHALQAHRDIGPENSRKGTRAQARASPVRARAALGKSGRLLFGLPDR